MLLVIIITSLLMKPLKGRMHVWQGGEQGNIFDPNNPHSRVAKDWAKATCFSFACPFINTRNSETDAVCTETESFTTNSGAGFSLLCPHAFI